ncbi:ROK family transcriptional regulator [Flexivirga alba]|uniref:ROK family protein n=1 Tax=Flexivirga alba TaxID=702742 RepID=A0ABW2AC72_9MICO
MAGAGGRRHSDYEGRIVRELRRAGALGRSEIVRRTGLPRSSVFAIVTELIARGVLVESHEIPGSSRGRGRPGTTVSLDPDSGLIAGVDVARDTVRVVIANVAHQIIAAGKTGVPPDRSLPALVTAIDDLLTELRTRHDIDAAALEAIGVGVYGLPGIHGSAADDLDALIEGLGTTFGVPVMVGNNTTFAALAEATWGAGRGVSDQLYVRWSVGVGGGYMLGGHVVQGSHGFAGEIGHVCVDPAGPECTCGGTGCLETYVGASRLLDQCAERGMKLENVDALVDSAKARMTVAYDVVLEAAERIGFALAGAVSQLDPARVIIGGELGQLGRPVLEVIEAQIGRRSMPRLLRAVEVVPAELGVNDAALGAVAHVMRHWGAWPRPDRRQPFLSPKGLAGDARRPYCLVSD